MGKTINITIPLSEEDLDKYFDEIENHNFIVDVDNSEYTGKKMLNYIYNSGMTCNFQISACDARLEELMVEYIRFDRTVSIPVLNELWGLVLMRYLKQKTDECDSVLNSFVQDFVAKHGNILEELSSLMSSVMIHMSQVISGQDGIIDGAENRELKETGLNFISLRNGAYFWEAMSAAEETKPAYNYNILSDFCYEGRRLSAILSNEFNPFGFLSIVLMQNELEGEITDAENHTDK